MPPPLTNAAERGTIEIEKESLPVRRLAQVMKLLYEKVADSLDGGGYFFMLLNSSTISVTMIASIINTMESNSKSLMKLPSLLQDSP